MKIANGGQSNVVESSGVQTTSAFNIARTPHMFNILSSGLYSDKIGAVLREVGCNAVDAHIMVGKPELPIQVKLPTPLDRSFFVKDWGPGLNDQEVRELYSTYGWSSKQQRDDVTGAFGLGSKSPFAYTMQNDEDSDGFTVEAVKDGIKRIYTCYIGESGAPAISRLFEGPAESDWQHGLKVTFPVRERDVNEFHEKAKEVFRWFAVTPEVLGLNGVIEMPEFRMRSDFFAMPEQGWSSEERACVIMGGVRYPLKAARLRDLSETEQALLKVGIHLWVPMGTVMMTPSREELEYTERTRNGIKEWLGKAALEVATRIREAVEATKESRWAWYKNIQEYASTLPFGVSMRLKEFLTTAGMDAGQVADLISIVANKAAKVPNWVGDGLAGPGYKPKMDPNTGLPLRDTEGRLIPDLTTGSKGCRVWVYTASTSRQGGVVRKEILGGQIRAGDKYEDVPLLFASNVKAFYTDAKQADARVRGAVVEGHVQTALLVMPCKGTDQEYSQVYAERMTTQGALEGLPLGGVSELEVPESVREARERRKQAREQTPREYFSDTVAKYMNLNGTIVDTTLGELEDSDLYYVCVSNLGQSRRERWTNDYSSSDGMCFNGYNRPQVLLALKTVVEFLQLPITGVVLMDKEGRAKRLKLREQGFKPLLPQIREALRDADNWAKLTAGVDRTPNVKLKEMYWADDYGWLGILGHHMVMRTPFWRLFKADAELAELRTEVRQFVARVRSKTAGGKAEVRDALMTLASKLAGMNISTGDLTEQNCYEVKNEFISRRPMMGALSDSTLKDWMDKTPLRALQALKLTQQLETTPAAATTSASDDEEDEHNERLVAVVEPE